MKHYTVNGEELAVGVNHDSVMPFSGTVEDNEKSLINFMDFASSVQLTDIGSVKVTIH